MMSTTAMSQAPDSRALREVDLLVRSDGAERRIAKFAFSESNNYLYCAVRATGLVTVTLHLGAVVLLAPTLVMEPAEVDASSRSSMRV